MTPATTDRFDVVFAALSDPTRRAIVRRLADGEATVLELAAWAEHTRAAWDQRLDRLDAHLRRTPTRSTIPPTVEKP